MNLRDKPFVSFLGAALRGIIGRNRYYKAGRADEAGTRTAGSGGGGMAEENKKEKEDGGTDGPNEVEGKAGVE